MQQVKIGVVGVGRMGKNHCRVLTSIRTADLVGVFDTDQKRALQVAGEYETDSFKTFDQMLDAVDALIIATPTKSHHPLAMLSIDAGVHILVEKPLAEDLAEGEEIKQLAEDSGILVQVGHIERFNPAYRELKNLIRPVHVLAIDSRRLSAYDGSNTDVDVIFDLLVHDIDLVTDLTGREPDDIAAIGIRAMSGNIDHVVVHLSYSGGPLVSMVASRVTEEKIRKIEVTALEAFIESDLMDKKVSIKRRTIGEYTNHNFDGVKYRQESILESIHVPMLEPLFLQAQHFIACVRKEEKCLVPAQDGLRAMRIGTLIRDKAIEGIIDIPIASSEIPPKSEAVMKG